MLLNDFPYPMTVTMVQLTSITLYSGPFFNMWGVRKFVDINWGYYIKVIVPLALGKFLASVFSHISIWKVPVSYAHTGKCWTCTLNGRSKTWNRIYYCESVLIWCEKRKCHYCFFISSESNNAPFYCSSVKSNPGRKTNTDSKFKLCVIQCWTSCWQITCFLMSWTVFSGLFISYTNNYRSSNCNSNRTVLWYDWFD